MTRVAVIAHAGKSFGDGLPELRRELARQGVDDPLWIEVPKSKFVAKQVKRVLAEGCELLFAWGGDGTVQQCVDQLAGTETPLGPGRRLLNPGSVGQPRDGDPRAAWLLLDREAGTASFRRVEYDVARTQEEIRERGLPDGLADRLAHGL